MFGSEKNFGLKKMGGQNKFLVWKIVLKKNFGPKNFLIIKKVLKNFGSKKI